MIRRHVLAALSAGVAVGDEDAARRALDGIDPALRGLARRRLEHLLIDASLATGAHDDQPATIQHRLRAAALLAAGAEADLVDREHTTAAYAQLVVRPLPRLPIATIGVAAVAGAMAVTIVATAVTIVAASPDAAFTRPAPPAAVGAFRDGGAPERDPALEELVARELPITVHHRTTIAALREPAALARYPAVAEAWRGMVDALAAWMDRDPGDPGFQRAARELDARVDVVSDQLAAARLGYYLEPLLAAAHGRAAGIYAYRIDEVAFVRADRDRVRVLGMRRLDRTDRTPDDHAVLGMTTEELDDPVVLLDRIEAKCESQILPVLYGAPYPLGAGSRVATAAGDAIRAELMTALGNDVEAIAAATARCHRIVAGSVRHHEAQHALDHDRDLRHPPPLAAYVGAPSSELALRARLELSAYLSQIASDVWLPHLVLWNLTRHAFHPPDVRIAAEAYVAVVIVEGLARQLGVRSPGPVIHHGAIDRDRLSALVAPIAGAPTTGLRSAAAALWRELFDEKLARMVDERR